MLMMVVSLSLLSGIISLIALHRGKAVNLPRPLSGESVNWWIRREAREKGCQVGYCFRGDHEER